MEMMGWVIAGLVCLYALYLARLLSDAQRELDEEHQRLWQAEDRAEYAERCHRRILEINHDLAQRSPMYFRDVPTLDGTAYSGETYPSPVVWWTYDN